MKVPHALPPLKRPWKEDLALLLQYRVMKSLIWFSTFSSTFTLMGSTVAFLMKGLRQFDKPRFSFRIPVMYSGDT